MFLSELLLIFTLSTASALAEISQLPAQRVYKRQDDLASFGTTIEVLGKMERTDQDFVDGLALDILSPTNRTLVVNQNQFPLSGAFVSGSSGEPFMALSNYSYVIRMNEPANDLIAKIELPYDPIALQMAGFTTANTYVGQLAADKSSWVVSESQRNVHETENKTRIIKMTSLEGEYILLGRKTADSANIFVQYGQGATRTVNLTGGAGVQEAEFIDGLRFSIQADAPMTMNVEIRSIDVVQGSIPEAFAAANSYVWALNTSDARNIRNASLLVPFTPSRFAPNTTPALAYRPLPETCCNTSTSSQGQFTVLPSRGDTNISVMNMQLLAPDTARFAITGLTQLDGEYLLLTDNGATLNNRNSTGTGGGTGGNAFMGNGTSTRSAASERRYVDTLLTYMVASVWVLLAGLVY